MNVLLISSSPHKEKSRTFLLAQEFMKGLGPSAKTEIIHLSDKKIEFCRHCEQCHENMLQCPIKDDVAQIIQKMLNSDGIILASPNYINHVTASMKALFDRSAHFIHCKRLLGKYVAGVVSSGSGHNTEVLDYMAHYSNTCGAQFAGGVSSGVPISEEKKSEARGLGGSFFNIITDKKIFPEQMKKIEESREHFRRIIEMRKKEWRGEYQYWKDKAWL